VLIQAERIRVLVVDSEFDHALDSLVRLNVLVRPKDVVCNITGTVLRKVDDGLSELAHFHSLNPVLVVGTEIVDINLSLGIPS
jgi:hypothetical protein